VPPQPLVADTGATDNYVSISCPVLNKRPTAHPIRISNPNGQVMTSTHEADLDLPTLRLAARRAHIVPDLHHCSLLSMGVLCDAGYTVEFDRTHMRVLDDGACVLTGTRYAPTGMWHINVPTLPAPAPSAQANKLSGTTIKDSVAYAHATLFSPALSTLEHALNHNFLTNFPGLNVSTLRRYAPTSIPMDKGHLDQVRQNVRSTKPPRPSPEPDTDTNPSPITTKTHECYAAIYEPHGQVYSDQTGRFIIPSSSGNNYIMIVYDFDSNSIFAQPFKNRTAACILDAYKILHEHLLQAGLKPRLQRLDNECSKLLKTFMHDQDVDFQLVPPGMHRRNAAERAIRTFQNHFIAGLCSVDKDFPLHLWDKLIPQAEITLNLLRASRINPNVSAYAQVNGTFDFNRTPLGPPGCRVLAHDKPDKRTTWAPHGLDGWYVGPALDSYRCWQIWIWESRAVRICDTVTWYPTKVTMPDSSSTATIVACLKDIVNALQHPSPQSPLSPLTDTHNQALRDITQLLTHVVTPPAAPTPPPPPPAVLRVAKPAPDTAAEQPTAPLRVPNPTLPVCVSPSPPRDATPTPAVTYAQVTGLAGKKRRTQPKPKNRPIPTSAPPLQPPPALTVAPPIPPPPPAVPPPSHRRSVTSKPLRFRPNHPAVPTSPNAVSSATPAATRTRAAAAPANTKPISLQP
jgi:hypothetical protein